jgi:hypothetical protein
MRVVITEEEKQRKYIDTWYFSTSHAPLLMSVGDSSSITSKQ